MVHLTSDDHCIVSKNHNLITSFLFYILNILLTLLKFLKRTNKLYSSYSTHFIKFKIIKKFINKKNKIYNLKLNPFKKIFLTRPYGFLNQRSLNFYEDIFLDSGVAWTLGLGVPNNFFSLMRTKPVFKYTFYLF